MMARPRIGPVCEPRLMLLIGGAGPFVEIARRQGALGYVLHDVQRRSGRDAGGGRPLDRDRAIVVVARDHLRPDGDAALRQRGHRHHVVGIVAHVDLVDVRDLAAVPLLALDIDLPDAAEQVEVVDVAAAERGPQRVEDRTDADAERLRLDPVDVEMDRGIGRRIGREDARQQRRGVGRAASRPCMTPAFCTASWPSSASS